MSGFILVFMSPEIAVNPPWRNIFKTPVFKERLSVLAIDEAHCISEWLVVHFCVSCCDFTIRKL